ncbi:hypothetical protein Y032_0559g3446 [Ancylostoma ceylanicum]|uniref:SCP domain-containing protein n=1 Tax=Ancylostoma ceylanicum TaxID=53326 RepID=A0A016WQZ4_9BILA|nr:hypothetical protein Y032_0559g3446 [Ancylostoma ceylanicum]
MAHLFVVILVCTISLNTFDNLPYKELMYLSNFEEVNVFRYCLNLSEELQRRGQHCKRTNGTKWKLWYCPTNLDHRYDCNAESYAQQHVNTCDGVYQPAYAHPGYKENVNVLGRQSDFAGAAQWAMSSWWSQLARFGMRTDMLFTEAIRTRTTNNIRKFTKVSRLRHCIA